MSEQYLLHGPASEIITPFTDDGKVDFELLEAEYEFLISNGVTGFFVNGLASEALMMSVDDRVEAVARAVKVTKGRVPVMGNLIFNSVDHAVACMRRYEDCGADGIFITPPLIYKYTTDGLNDYISGIAGATKLPVYLYNAPETGNKIPPEVIAKVFRDNPNMRGYKDSTQDVIHLQTVLSLIGKGRHFELMAGSDAQILSTSLLGGHGVVSLITCVFPKLIVEMCDAVAQKDLDRAEVLQGKILRVRQALKIGPFMSAYKYVAQLTGNPLGRIKAPLDEVNESEKEKIKNLLIKESMLQEVKNG
ncbi:MAG: dihydrodipicolinate synthase family protein [Oscillospiraceae bacterium]|nr:dihydrodipicolinate synthase family protein [Oscillospiraceae bacterium]